MCKHWGYSQEEPDQGADLLTCNESMSENFCWLQWNSEGLCQLSANHLLTSGATGTTWRKLVDAPPGWRWLTDNLSSQVRGGWVFPPGVELCDLWLTLETAVALSYKGWSRLGDARGGLWSLWIAAQGDWQEKNFLPTLLTASVFSFHSLNVKDSWAFTTAMCVPREVAVNGDKVPLKKQDFHATPRIKPAWHRASPGRFLKHRVRWSLLICPWQSCTEG